MRRNLLLYLEEMRTISPSAERAESVVFLKPHPRDFGAISPFEERLREELSPSSFLIVGLKGVEELVKNTRLILNRLVGSVEEDVLVSLLDAYLRSFNYLQRLKFWLRNSSQEALLVELHAYPFSGEEVPFKDIRSWYRVGNTDIIILPSLYAKLGNRIKKLKADVLAMKDVGRQYGIFQHFIKKCMNNVNECERLHSLLSKVSENLRLVEVPGVQKRAAPDSEPSTELSFGLSNFEKWYTAYVLDKLEPTEDSLSAFLLAATSKDLGFFM